MDQTEPERLCPHMTAGVCTVCEELDHLKEEVKRITQERDEARLLARTFLARWDLRQAMGYPPDCAPNDDEIKQYRFTYPWLRQA